MSTAPISIPLALIFLSCSSHSLMAKERSASGVHSAMRQAANAMLATFDPTQRAQLTFDFQGPQRTDWHFVPKERVGVNLRDMNLQQRRAAQTLMRSALSEKGYFKAITIMSLERVLREMESDRENVNEFRNSEKYWFAIFGDPSDNKPWGWRVEGHHLSLNFTSVEGIVSSATPLFLGTNPAEIRVGPRKGLRVLGNEEDRARRLVTSLSAEQQALAVIADQPPSDVLTVPGQSLDIGKPAGIAAADLTTSQRVTLQEMWTSFVQHLRHELAEQEIHAIEQAGIDDIHFAWAGGTKLNENHYFRLHGPTFILEYDNAQGNHAHLVWHSLENDFGADALQRHYQESPHHQRIGE